jgi:hypothetical protein
MALSCAIYGLGLEVNVPMAGLAGLPPPPRIDVSITVGAIPPHLAGPADALDHDIFVAAELNSAGEPGVRVTRFGAVPHYRFAYGDGTRIVVDSSGSRVWAQGADDATVEDTATYLLGPTLGFVLRLRGITCLHASAVAVSGKAIVFTGAAGAGKSTTAAAFARRGFPVVTDDVAPLRERDGRFEVVPAYPRVRLWPDSAESLFGSPDALPRITPTWDKRYLDLQQPGFTFGQEPLELAAIYVLAPRTPRGCEPEVLDPRSALMALVPETYSTRLLAPSQRAGEFDLLARLVDRVPVRRVAPCEDLAGVASFCDVILGDLARAGALDA